MAFANAFVVGEQGLAEVTLMRHCGIFTDVRGLLYFVMRRTDSEGEAWQLARVEVAAAASSADCDILFPASSRTFSPLHNVYIHSFSLVGSLLVVIAEQMQVSGAQIYVLDTKGAVLRRMPMTESESVFNSCGIFEGPSVPMVAACGDLLLFDCLWGMVELKLEQLGVKASTCCAARPDAAPSPSDILEHEGGARGRSQAAALEVRLRNGIVRVEGDVLGQVSYFNALADFRTQAGQPLEVVHLDASTDCFNALLRILNQAQDTDAAAGVGPSDELATMGLAVELCEVCDMLCWPPGIDFAHREIWRLFRTWGFGIRKSVALAPVLEGTLVGAYLKRALEFGRSSTGAHVASLGL
eukprot:gnl/TRDRNA2_/TRDRNA2_59138_c0_seq2.p1 gnl/TRDRNA2_/TRDRNA2_59138_c0~~gnl/TRDRNA2_/TRDRNA2_59138_c0_seq2.p1  ORF type:complete len:365 (-),score=58.70 gnl/TRDRNA2_/TRDRNA2_59138_c0_seq2:63-1127(-)